MRANSSANDTTSVSVTESSCVHSKDGLSTARTSYEKDLEQLAVEKAAPVAFSEGGRQGWLNVLGGALVAFCTFGVVQSYGVYQDYYTRMSLNEQTPSVISWIGSVQVFLVFAVGLPAGRLLDHGYFHQTMLAGTTIYTFSIFMLSITQPHRYYQTFLAQGLGMGLGMGLMFIPTLTITSQYFRRKRSLAMGLVVAGSSIGACIYPVLLNNIFERAPGFGWGVRSVGFLDLGLLLVANLLMKPKPMSPKQTTTPTPPVTLKEIVKDVPFLAFVVGTFLVFWGIFVPFFYLQLYAALHSVDPTFLKYSITIMNGASIFGRVVPNMMADHFGPLNVITVSSVICGGLMFALFGAKNVAGVAAFGVFYGFFSGGVISLAAPAVASFVTHSDLSDLGIRIGLLSFTLAFALLTGNPIAGALLTSNHRWEWPLTFAAVVVFGGSTCYLVLWKSLSKRKGSRII